jgi:hypothetical protein
MSKYECKDCNKQKDLRNSTLILVEGKVRTKEAKCECGEYMEEVKGKFTGFPTIIRNEPKR